MRAVAVLFLAAALPCSAQDGVPVQPVALSGQLAFNGAPGELFEVLSAANINQGGVVGFAAISRITPKANIRGLYRWQDGQGSRVARQDDPLPEHPVYRFRSFGTPLIDELGRFCFHASFSETSGAGCLVYGAPGAFRLVALSGADPNPNPTYLRVQQIGSELCTRSGTISFTEGQPQVSRIWSGIPTGLRIVSSAGDPAPGYGPGVTTRELGVTRLSESGAVVGLSQISGSGYTGERVDVRADAQGRSIFAGPGLAAPGTGGLMLAAGQSPGTNGSGVLTFAASFQVQNGAIQVGAWIGPPGNLLPIAFHGDPAPGLRPGNTFSFIDSPVSNQAGDALFLGGASVSGPATIFGLWAGSPDGLRLVMAPGTPVTNMPPGTAFLAMAGGVLGPNQTAFNNRSQVAVLARITIPGSPSQTALLVTRLRGELVAIAVTGRPFQVAPGDIRIVSAVHANGGFTSGTLAAKTGDDGNGTFFNDRGQLVFAAQFTDGSSGLFLANAGPEPCYANCDAIATLPVLNVNDFVCFQTSFAAGEPYADCDQTGSLNVNDFICFQRAFAAGCSGL